MPIETLPDATEPSLGKPKVDVKPYTQPDNQVSAEIWNRVVSRVVEVFGEVGLTDGSTAGSLNARVRSIESYGVSGGDVSSSFSDFKDASSGEGWRALIGDSGDAVFAGSLTKEGFPSSGAAVLTCEAGNGESNARVVLCRPGDGLNCDAKTRPVVEFRIFRPHTITGGVMSPTGDCRAYVGVGGGMITDDGAEEMVVFGIFPDGSYGVMVLKNGDFEHVTFVAGSNLPSAQAVQIRLTIGNDTLPTVAEASADFGETYVTLVTTNPSVAAQRPTQTTYVPMIGLSTDKDEGSGIKILAVDWMRATARRSGSGAGPFDGEHALKFPTAGSSVIVDAGSYSPTLTPPSGGTLTVTSGSWEWTRIGGAVRVVGTMQVTPTGSSAGLAGTKFSLPFAAIDEWSVVGMVVGPGVTAPINSDGTSNNDGAVGTGTITSGMQVNVMFQFRVSS